MDNNYLGNPNLKRANVPVEWTEEQIEEYTRCMKDPMYFIETYIRIVSLDEGIIPFKLYDFQKEMVGTFHKNRLGRNSGIIFILMYVAYIGLNYYKF